MGIFRKILFAHDVGLYFQTWKKDDIFLVPTKEEPVAIQNLWDENTPRPWQVGKPDHNNNFEARKWINPTESHLNIFYVFPTFQSF